LTQVVYPLHRTRSSYKRVFGYHQGGIWRGDGGHVPLTRLWRPSHWNCFSDPWVGCL